MLSDLLVLVAVLIARCMLEPSDYGGDGLGDVVSVGYELGIIVDRASLIEIRPIDEMPWALPAATFALDIICECGALDHRVVAFFLGPAGIGLRENCQDLLNVCNDLWMRLLQKILSYSCHKRVPLAPPSMDL